MQILEKPKQKKVLKVPKEALLACKQGLQIKSYGKGSFNNMSIDTPNYITQETAVRYANKMLLQKELSEREVFVLAKYYLRMKESGHSFNRQVTTLLVGGPDFVERCYREYLSFKSRQENHTFF